MDTPKGALDSSKLIFLTIFDSLWVYGTLGDMLTSIVKFSIWETACSLSYDILLAAIFCTMSPTLYFPIDEILLTRPPGHLQS